MSNTPLQTLVSDARILDEIYQNRRRPVVAMALEVESLGHFVGCPTFAPAKIALRQFHSYTNSVLNFTP